MIIVQRYFERKENLTKVRRMFEESGLKGEWTQAPFGEKYMTAIIYFDKSVSLYDAKCIFPDAKIKEEKVVAKEEKVTYENSPQIVKV